MSYGMPLPIDFIEVARIAVISRLSNFTSLWGLFILVTLSFNS
jgi:hypothetical protein